MEKYYTPDSTEFKIGLQLERYKTFHLKWENIELIEDDFRSDLNQNNEFSKFLEKPELYRIKILDNKDIESTNFKFIKTLKSKNFPHSIDVFKEPNTDWYISKYNNCILVRVQNLPNINIKQLKYLPETGTTLFLGNIRNKSELTDILAKFK